MDDSERLLVLSSASGRVLAGAWYLKGFSDAYDARWAVVPAGPAGMQYRKGYALGLAAYRRECFAAMYGSPPESHPASQLYLQLPLPSDRLSVDVG